MNESGGSQKATITISANGQPRAVRAGSTIADLLREVSVTPSHVVVQMDGAIIPRGEFEQTILHEGNTLEIVTLVGGG
ncbi:MAG TPA: sulfur carrier protein ThiS [Ktedonobacteraceae bacterium]|nr:sulfur carrier protein ThiS [Ktedonobacteraceae bacterium]